MAIITPALGAFYLIWQIHKRDLRGWQHYACLTSLIFLISILFLVSDGRIESFGLAGNTVKLVDQKLEETRKLTEQNKRIAKISSQIALLLARPITFDSEDSLEEWMNLRQKVAELLKEAEVSDREITSALKRIDNYIEILKRRR